MNEKTLFFIRGTWKPGGNLLYGISSAFDTHKNSEGNYTFLGIQYAQYVRPTLDIRYYALLGKQHSVVSRFFGGIGVPYGNADALPMRRHLLPEVPTI